MTTITNRTRYIARKENSQYSLSYRLLHLMMGGGFVLLLLAGQQFNLNLSQAYKESGLMYHSTIGSVVLLSAFVLVLKRFIFHSTRPLNGLKGMKSLFVNATQVALYGLAILVPISGLLTAFYSESPTMVFGFFNISQRAIEPEIFQSIRQIHEFLTFAAIGLAGLHISAAMYHHFVKKDEVLESMIIKLPRRVK